MSDIANYELTAVVAVGSTGTVWKGRHRALDRVVAVKELSPVLRVDGVALARFRAEAQRLSELDDEHVVKIFDYVEGESGTYIIEEWVDGQTLEQVLARVGRLKAEQSLGVLRGGLLGLAAAHDKGLVHGDVSPSNIILDANGVSKMIDFGVAGPAGEAGRFGTPAYMSPEAASGAALSPASDVYSAAALLFTLLKGVPPMPGPDVVSVLRQHREAPPPALEGHGPSLRELLLAAMAKDPLSRPANARQFLAALEEAARRRYGAGWLSRAGVAGLVGGGVTDAVVQGAGGEAAATADVASPVVSTAVNQQPASPPSHETVNASSGLRLRRPGSRMLLIAGGVAVLAVAAIAIALTVSGGGTSKTASVVTTPSPSSPSPTAKPIKLIRPATAASVTATASLVTTYVVSGACSGQGSFKTVYRFSATHLPLTSTSSAIRLSAVPGAALLAEPPVTVTCPGFSFPLSGSTADRVVSTGTIGRQVNIQTVDLTHPGGLPPNIPATSVDVAIDTAPDFVGPGIVLSNCNATTGPTAVRHAAFPCLPANHTYRVVVPLSASGTTCEGKASTTVSPVNVSCQGSGKVLLVIRTYAAPTPHVTSSPSG